MADLTDILSTDMATKPVRAADVSNSALTGAVGRMGNFLDTFASQQQRRAQQNRQAAEDAKKADKEAAQNDVARSIVDTNAIFRGEGPGPIIMGEPTTDADGSGDPSSPIFDMAGATPDEAALASNKSADRLRSIKAAVDQGRMPTISYNSAVFKETQRLMAAHPGQEATILQTLKDHGFNSTFTQMFDEETKLRDKNFEAAVNLDNKAFEKGMTFLDPEIRAGMSREEIVAAGYNQLSAESKLNWAQQEYTYAQQINNANKTEAASTLSNTLITQTWNDTRNITDMISKGADAIMRLPVGQQAAAWETLGVKAIQYIDSYVSLVSAKAASARLPPEDYNAIKDRIQGIASQYKSFFTGDSSVYSSRIKSYTTFMNSAKLNAADAAPLYWGLKQIGISDTTLEQFSTAITGDANLQKKLNQEASGFASRFQGDLGSSTLINVVKMLSGQTTLKDMSFSEARAAMPTLNRTAKSITTLYNAGKHDNPGEVINAIGQMVLAADTINPSSDYKTMLVATDGFALPATQRALRQLVKDPQHNDVAEATIIASRAASMQIIQSSVARISKLNNSSAAHKIVFDDKTGVYRVETDKKILARVGKPISGVDRAVLSDPTTGFGGPDVYKAPPIPAEMSATVNLLNTNIGNAVALADIDPTAPKGANSNDLFRFYGSGGRIVPDSIKQVKKQGDTSTPGQDVATIIGTLESEFKRMGDQVLGTNIHAPSIITAEGTGKNPNSSAEGPGQFLDSTFREMMKEVHPDVKLPADNADLGPLKKQYGASLVEPYARKNAGILSSAGLPASKENVYLSHFFGPKTAVKVLQSNPNTPIEAIVGGKVVGANPHLRGKTVAETLQWASNFINRG